MVDDRRHLREQPLVGDLPDDVDVPGFDGAGREPSPAGSQNAALTRGGQGIHHPAGELLRVAAGHAAEADVDRRRPLG